MTSYNAPGFQSSDSGVFVLDPEDRALLRACAEASQDDAGELLAHKRFLKVARDLPPVRLEKVMKIRKLIADDEYLSPEKLQGAIDRLLEVLR